MSQEQELLARGAELVTGDLILNRKTVGRYRNGNFYPTEDGLAELEIVEVEAKPAPAPAPRKKKGAAAETTPADTGDNLEDILGGE